MFFFHQSPSLLSISASCSWNRRRQTPSTCWILVWTCLLLRSSWTNSTSSRGSWTVPRARLQPSGSRDRIGCRPSKTSTPVWAVGVQTSRTKVRPTLPDSLPLPFTSGDLACSQTLVCRHSASHDVRRFDHVGLRRLFSVSSHVFSLFNLTKMKWLQIIQVPHDWTLHSHFKLSQDDFSCKE